jgi:hypothetical protein
MEQRSTRLPQKRAKPECPSGDPADLLPNVRSIADCLKEWTALRRRAIPVALAAVELRTEAGTTSNTNNQEPLPC